MKLKALIPLISCLFYFHEASAQRRNIYFFKDNGTEVKVRDSADFIRVVSEPDSGSKLYNVTEFYLNKKPKLMGRSSEIEILRFEGLAITYYRSGNKQTITTYNNGIKIGDAYEYYPNGKLYIHKQYTPGKIEPHSSFVEKSLIIDCLDSTGKQLVINGNGYYMGYDNKFKDINEEGNLKSGLRDGEWKGGYKTKTASLSFKEVYSNGELLSGESIDESGTVYTYKNRETAPEFKGGLDAFGKFLARNIRYPSYARSRNVQGKVIVGFVVEKDGTLSGIKVLVNPDDELSMEAMRVLRQSPNWIAGKQHGKPVRVAYTVPVNFALGYN
jgi:TonB family protein